jgi:hypothetical protein
MEYIHGYVAYNPAGGNHAVKGNLQMVVWYIHDRRN